jgi:hypothetical protein
VIVTRPAPGEQRLAKVGDLRVHILDAQHDLQSLVAPAQ